MSLYALTILVFATTRSNAAVSALVMSFLLPTILLSAVAGVLVDRLDVRWAMIVPNAIRTAVDARPRPRRRQRRDAPAAQSRHQPDDRGPDPGRGLDDPADRPEAPARDGDGDLQPDAPGVVRRRVRVPWAARRRDRRPVVRARRRHRLLRGGDGHDPVPAVGAAGRPRARRRSPDVPRTDRPAARGPRRDHRQPRGRPPADPSRRGRLARRRDRRPGAEPRAVDRPRSEEPDRRRPAAGPRGRGRGVRPAPARRPASRADGRARAG